MLPSGFLTQVMREAFPCDDVIVSDLPTFCGNSRRELEHEYSSRHIVRKVFYQLKNKHDLRNLYQLSVSSRITIPCPWVMKYEFKSPNCALPL